MSVNYKPNQIGKVDLSHEYLAKVAALMGRKVRRTENPKGWYIEGDKDRLPEAIDLLARPEGWLELIRWYTGKLNSAIESEST